MNNWKIITKQEYHNILSTLAGEHGVKKIKHTTKNGIRTYTINGKPVLQTYTETDNGGRKADVYKKFDKV